MKWSRAQMVPVLVGGVLLGCLSVATIKAERFTHRPYLYDDLYLPSGDFIGQVSMGYRQIAADFIWMSAVQYYGGYRHENHDLNYFEGLIEIVNELDPHFIFPYVFGAVVMSQDVRDFDRATAILKRGMVRNPTSWELPFEIGFLYYIDANNPQEAVRYFDLASRIPGSPDQARRFAAFVYSELGHTQTSMLMWQTLKETTNEPYMRELAERYLEKLERGESLRSYENE